MPLAPYLATSASESPVLNRASGSSPLASSRFFFSPQTSSGSLFQVISIPESSFQVVTSSIVSKSGASADFAPPKARVSSSVTIGTPESVMPTSEERSSVVRSEGREQPETPSIVTPRAVADRVK